MEIDVCNSTIASLYGYYDRVAQQYAMHQSRAIRVLMQDGEIRSELKKKPGDVDSTRWVDSFYTAIIGDSVNVLENPDKTGDILISNRYKDFVSLEKYPGSIGEKLSQEVCF